MDLHRLGSRHRGTPYANLDLPSRPAGVGRVEQHVRKRPLQGIVMESVETPAVAEPRLVEAKLGDAHLISPERVALARWIGEFYLSPLFPAVALMLPPGWERKPLTYFRITSLARGDGTHAPAAETAGGTVRADDRRAGWSNSEKILPGLRRQRRWPS
jgi:primosomal protein N'